MSNRDQIVSLAGLMAATDDSSMQELPVSRTLSDSRAAALAGSVLAGHLIMLEEQGVIDGRGLAALADGLDRTQAALAGSNLSMRRLVEELASRIDSQAPPELAGAISLGLAREEWLATTVRLAWRQALDDVLLATINLRESLLTLADTHVVTIMPAFAGNRAAQPTNLGHLLGGVIVPLRSATRRLVQARAAIDRSPLGAGLLAGDFLSLDRERQAAVLGFSAPVGNTLDAVMSVEDVVEAGESVAAAVAPVRRFLRELGAWMRSDPDSFILTDAWLIQAEATNPLFAQPEPIEILMQRIAAIEERCRALVARLREASYGPIGSQADALVDAAFAVQDAVPAVMSQSSSLLTEGMTINRAYLGNRSGRAYTTGSDLAAFLMTEEGLPPATARAIAAMVLRQVQEQKLEVSGIQQDMIDSAAMMTIGREIKVEMETLGRYLAPRRYLERRAVLGSPASASTREWLASERADLDTDRAKANRERSRGESAIAAVTSVLAEASASVD